MFSSIVLEYEKNLLLTRLIFYFSVVYAVPIQCRVGRYEHAIAVIKSGKFCKFHRCAQNSAKGGDMDEGTLKTPTPLCRFHWSFCLGW